MTKEVILNICWHDYLRSYRSWYPISVYKNLFMSEYNHIIAFKMIFIFKFINIFKMYDHICDHIYYICATHVCLIMLPHKEIFSTTIQWHSTFRLHNSIQECEHLLTVVTGPPSKIRCYRSMGLYRITSDFKNITTHDQLSSDDKTSIFSTVCIDYQWHVGH